jgi:uncharacterized cupin superfamily protein
MGVETITVVSRETGEPFVPTLDSYEIRSERWEECEYHCIRDDTDQVLVAFWEGDPGVVYLGPWPYDELCILLEGRVALVDEDGGRREFTGGQAFVVPRTFSGAWETVEPSRKIFVAINTRDAGESTTN